MKTEIKTRGRQAKPTKVEVVAAWDRLRTAATAGDLQASALLIALAEGKPLTPVVEAAHA
jgi:sugar/nucleoside kinase (ribokinase family)